jgi:glycosyltransferase involved in cell wall biosynthesis
LPLWYAAATAFVFPSIYEGFGMPPLEAMACGTPVITSNTSSLPEVVGDAGLMVDPRDPSALSSAILRVLNDPDLRAEMRTRGLQQAARFRWETTAERTLQAYAEAHG